MPKQRPYVLCPGTVTSRHDGQEHYISARQLARLYGVRSALCVVLLPDDVEQNVLRGYDNPETLVFLHPRQDGLYSHVGTPQADGV